MARAPRVVVVAALLPSFWGCGTPAPRDEPAAAASAASPAPQSSPRRPTRRWFLGRTGAACTVYSVDGDRATEIETTPCPPDLLAGERIRIAGKTCLREGETARERPVVCPDALTNAEKQARASPP